MTALAEQFYSEQEALIVAAVRATAEIWGGIDPTRFAESWIADRVGDLLLVTVARAQEIAAEAADAYTDMILAEQGIEEDSDGDVVPAALAGVASDGRPLDSLLLQALVQASVIGARGGTLLEAKTAGESVLTRIVGTQVADAGRGATSIGVVARPRVGWVRLVEPGACSRCVVLAGRFYRWSNGFDRHPLCKCRNIPASEDTEDITAQNDPMKNFRALSETEQNRQFTKAGAQAIRDGADISRVVNARRGALGLSAPGRLTRAEQEMLRGGKSRGSLKRTDVYGRPVYLTREGSTIRADWGKQQIAAGNSRRESYSTGRKLTVATTPRLMPESIYEIATDREDAVRLLKKSGYIT